MAFDAHDYELRLFSTWGSHDLNNTFYYRDGAEEATAANLGDNFYTAVLPFIMDVVAGSINYNRIYVRSLGNPDDFYDRIIDQDGTRDATINNIVDRWYFKFTRSVNGRNDGKKLIGIPADDDTKDNGVDPVANPPLEDCALAMFASLGAIAGNFIPCNMRYSLHAADEDHEKPYYVPSYLEPVSQVSFIRLSHKVS